MAERRTCPECKGEGTITGTSKVVSMWWTTFFMSILMGAVAIIGWTAFHDGMKNGLAQHCPAEKECPEVKCPEAKACIYDKWHPVEDCLTSLPANCALIGGGKPTCLRNKRDVLRIGVETKDSTAFEPVVFYTHDELKKLVEEGAQDGGS